MSNLPQSSRKAKSHNNCPHHIEISLHSPEQQRMFFAVGHSLGFPADKLKERAKKVCGVDCFNALTKTHLMYLIDKLVGIQNK